MADINVNKEKSPDSTTSKCKIPYDPDDMSSYINKQPHKARRLSYSHDELDKTTLIDDSKVDNKNSPRSYVTHKN